MVPMPNDLRLFLEGVWCCLPNDGDRDCYGHFGVKTSPVV